jgi:hypothetical protein
MNREEVLKAMQADIEYATKNEPEWLDEITFTHNGQDYTPKQLIKEAEAGTEVGLAFMNEVFIPNLEDQELLLNALLGDLDEADVINIDGDEEQTN